MPPTIIAQISDLHIGLPDGDMDRQVGTADYLAAAVKHLNELEPGPDLVVISGDLVDKREAGEYQRLRGLLDPLAMPYLLMVGNHDHRARLRDAFSDHGYLNRGPGDFIQYCHEAGDLNLIVLDTLIDGSAEGELCELRLAWLDEALRQHDPSRTMIFMHHPPFRTGIELMDGMGLRDAEAFLDILQRHAPVLRVQCGHLHRPIQKLAAGTLIATAPSAAHQIALDLKAGGGLAIAFEPPAALLHVWFGPEDGLITHQSYIGDFRQIDLTKYFRK